MKSRDRSFFLLLFNILIFQVGANNQDICESCKHIDECPQFGMMSAEQQQLWTQKFPCDAPEEENGTPAPGFSSVAKGDYVCCPGAQVWGLRERSINPLKTQNGVEGNTHFIKYQPLQFLYNQLNNYDDYNSVCKPQNTPPSPASGCCGIDTSNGDMLTDLEDFLQFRYRRTRREADFDELGVSLDNRIAGGQDTDLDQYPWTAHLSIEFGAGFESKFFNCGGSLISSRFILTAAHCMVNGNDQLKSVNVTLAEYNKKTFPTDCVIGKDRKPVCVDNLMVTAEKVIIHPEFIEEYLINDIALLQLRDLAPYTRSIRPICLPSINIDSPLYSDLPLATAGWGLNVFAQSDVKQFTTIHMVPKNVCTAHYSRLTDGHLCASGRRTEDTCKGDSGGPLMMLYKGKYYLVGIVSGKTASYHCGTPVPSLYTNVYNYLNWIKYYVS